MSRFACQVSFQPLIGRIPPTFSQRKSPSPPSPASRGGVGEADQGTHMSQNVGLRITAEGRLFGLDSGDWMMLVGGFALVALVVLLI